MIECLYKVYIVIICLQYNCLYIIYFKKEVVFNDSVFIYISFKNITNESMFIETKLIT